MIAGILLDAFKKLPSPDKLIEKPRPLTTKIYDKNGVMLYKIYRNQNRTLVPLKDVPDFFIKATLAIEDKDFYNHKGVSLKGIIRAAIHNLTNPENGKEGGSTITQQLVKNVLLTSEKTWERKIKEAVLALMVEEKFSKNQILQMYFNEVPYGGVAYGAEEAAQKYFRKSVRDINPSESAFLAGITRSPSVYSPFGLFPDLVKKRQEQVINEMIKAKNLTLEEAAKISAEPLRFAVQKEFIKAPHFVFYIKELLAEKYGLQTVEEGGLEIVTTLDYSLQQETEKIIQEELEKLKSLRIGNGAALIVSPKTGAVLSMVGAKDYFDFEKDGNVNVIFSLRQPGSAIKPVNYATALQTGFTAATIIPDTPITFKIAGLPPYSPKNYDNKFHGNVPLRTALASSLNVPAVKVLASYGVDRMIKTGQSLGITSWNEPSRFGLSLTLGGGEVKLFDLVQTYSVLANLGEKIDLNPLVSVKTSRGKILYQNNCLLKKNCPSEKVLDSGISFILNSILSDNEARTLAFGPNSLLKIDGKTVSAKTGTTNNLRDNWCLGYTPSFAVGVWVGNNDNTPMSYVASGVTGATPIWNKIITTLLAERPDESWFMPENVTEVKICRATGTLSCAGCPNIRSEYFLKGTEPKTACQFEPSSLPVKLSETSQ